MRPGLAQAMNAAATEVIETPADAQVRTDAQSSTDPIRATTAAGEPLVDGPVRLLFAVLSCLGGLILISDPETKPFAAVAIFFSIFGYLFVDYLRLFSLPPLLAYLAMIGSAIYCISDFVRLEMDGDGWFSISLYRSGARHLIAVAQLLVLVQAILMLQLKTRRVCEQLCVFCLLELIVAAVFNHAISFGLLLIPIGLVAACGLALLSAHTATENASGSFSIRSVLRPVIWGLVPAVLLVGATFFYAVPRTTEAAQISGQGNALVGFSDTVRLEQFGQMLQSTDVAMRVWLSNRSTNEPYKVIGGLYLRGRTLEHYKAQSRAGSSTADWSSLESGAIPSSQAVPGEFLPVRYSDRNFFDTVNVRVDCESIRSESLFAIAPYFFSERRSDVLHQLDRWTLRRQFSENWVYPRIKYSFSTTAFRRGIQTDLISRYAPGEVHRANETTQMSEPGFLTQWRQHPAESRWFRSPQNYRRLLLQFDPEKMPTVKQMADAIVSSIPESERNAMEIARRFEQFLSTTGGFEYTLNLDAKPAADVDPIEHFMATTRRGHCQYFASTLAMMLRSQGIPARLVVGYQTDDFNDLGGYFVARQSHAHAWTEALISKDDLSEIVYGQPDSEEYWLRLDPTPGGRDSFTSGQGVSNVLDLAQTLWNGYVVEMSPRKDSGSGDRAKDASAIAFSRDQLAAWLELMLDRLRAGQLGGGSLAIDRRFSWVAALAGVLFAFFTILLLKLPGLIWRRRRRQMARRAMRPRIDFYAETLDCLASLGIQRNPSETPIEFADAAITAVQIRYGPAAEVQVAAIEDPLRLLTDAFYRLRFGVAEGASERLLERAHATQNSDVENERIAQSLGELKKQVRALRQYSPSFPTTRDTLS